MPVCALLTALEIEQYGRKEIVNWKYTKTPEVKQPSSLPLSWKISQRRSPGIRPSSLRQLFFLRGVGTALDTEVTCL